MLEAQKLATRRGLARLFTGLSFRVDPGEALIVTGANGTGKTTLLRMLAGPSAPSDGEIRWNGRPAAPFDPALRSALAFAGHLPSLKDELTAEENLASLVALAGEAAATDSIRDALDNVALSRQRGLPACVLSARAAPPYRPRAAHAAAPPAVDPGRAGHRARRGRHRASRAHRRRPPRQGWPCRRGHPRAARPSRGPVRPLALA